MSRQRGAKLGSMAARLCLPVFGPYGRIQDVTTVRELDPVSAP